MTGDSPPSETPAPSDQVPAEKPAGSWVVTVLFWGTMLTAAALYAVVALSPKLVSYLRLRDEHYRTQVRLVTLERRVQYLKKVMHALEHDPEFASQQARLELDAERPGDEHIPVSEKWHFTPDADFDPAAFKESILPWYTPLLEIFACDTSRRRGLLITAAVLSLLAFTFFQESQTSQIVACARGIRAGWLRATARYRPPNPPHSQGTDSP